MPKQYIIAGIGTEIGKTVCSAIVTKALQADYWKPVQAGNLTDGDAYWVQQWVPGTHVFDSTYMLTNPLSPHTAAEMDDIRITLDAFHLPVTQQNLIVELAGGIMVPLNEHQTNLDLMQHLGLRDAVHVPYKGGAMAMNDLLGGHVDLAVMTLTTPPVALRP